MPLTTVQQQQQVQQHQAVTLATQPEELAVQAAQAALTTVQQQQQVQQHQAVTLATQLLATEVQLMLQAALVEMALVHQVATEQADQVAHRLALQMAE
jgi:hypothetical protein